MFSNNQLKLKSFRKWGAFLGLPKAKTRAIKNIVTFAQANVDGWLKQGKWQA